MTTSFTFNPEAGHIVPLCHVWMGLGRELGCKQIERTQLWPPLRHTYINTVHSGVFKCTHKSTHNPRYRSWDRCANPSKLLVDRLSQAREHISVHLLGAFKDWLQHSISETRVYHVYPFTPYSQGLMVILLINNCILDLIDHFVLSKWK